MFPSSPCRMFAMKVGQMKVGSAGGGGFGGTAVAWFLSGLHGYCFGYCFYVLAVNPTFISTRLAIFEKFPGLKDSE
ncbi:unnamed protein product [Polarella glacialis]|uniref:Uncharacterized protein n=1 Tax=Polarella glacialis TaxID=89957 RepID=A0A813EN81_POLGL|nr:unnamed protein product [Polarella glacialis]